MDGIELGVKEGLLGLAVQSDGDLLFVAHSAENKVFVFDKRSGASRGAFSVSTPGRIATDAKGNLWVCCRIDGKGAAAKFSSFRGWTQSQYWSFDDLEAPAAVAISPVDGAIVIADAGDTQQLKAFDPTGAPLWTYGQKGGYDNGPAVTTDKFFFKQTLLAFQPDGSFWVKDEATNRVLHFAPDRHYSTGSCISRIRSRRRPIRITRRARSSTGWSSRSITASRWTTGCVEAGELLGAQVAAGFVQRFRRWALPCRDAQNGRTYGLILGGEYSAKKVAELTLKGPAAYRAATTGR